MDFRNKIKLIFLLALIPISFFPVIIKVSSYVAGYAGIALIATGLYISALQLRLSNFRNKRLINDIAAGKNMSLLIVLFIVLIATSTLLSIDLVKSLRGLFLVLTLVILVYYLYLRSLNSKMVVLLFKLMIGIVLLLQLFNAIVLFAKLPIPTFLQSGYWPYLYRWFPSIIHNNISGAMIVLTVPALVKLAFASKGRGRLTYIVLGCFTIFGLFFSTSKAAILMVLTYFIILLGFRFQRSFKFILKAFVILSLVLFTLVQVLPENVKVLFRMNQGLSGRELLWAKGFDYIQSRPLFGVGFRTVPEVRLGNGMQNLHNIYIAMAVDFGVLATLVLLILIFYYLVITIKKALKLKHKETQFIAFSCIAFIISVMVHQFFEQTLFFFGNHYYANVYFVIYLAILNHIIYKEKEIHLTK